MIIQHRFREQSLKHIDKEVLEGEEELLAEAPSEVPGINIGI